MTTDRKWELTHLATLFGILVILAAVPKLTGTKIVPTVFQPLRQPAGIPHPAPARAKPANPNEVTVGPTGINSRYRLIAIDRKPATSTSDRLVLRLHVTSLATPPLVSPLESDMFELQIPGQAAVHPQTAFRVPLPADASKDQDLAFQIPTTLRLDHAALRIHYYNDQQQIQIDTRAIAYGP